MSSFWSNLKTIPQPTSSQSTTDAIHVLEFEPNSSQFVEVESQNESVNPDDKPINSSLVAPTARIQGINEEKSCS